MNEIGIRLKSRIELEVRSWRFAMNLMEGGEHLKEGKGFWTWADLVSAYSEIRLIYILRFSVIIYGLNC